jgi:hypothetical protein
MRLASFATLLVGVLCVSACTTVKVLPALLPGEVSAPELRLPALYKGDPRHLPLGVVAVSSPDAPFEYAFRVDYRRDDVPAAITLFNPLTLFGCPIGWVHVTAVATLTARAGGVAVKRYEATATVDKTRTLYSSDSLTELRLRALAAARDSIEAQIRADATYLLDLASAAAQSTSPAAPEVNP